MKTYLPPQRLYKLLIGVFLILLYYLAVERFFRRDEFEHIHSTWYVLQGAVPYKDFFQHHHPLLWYAMSPVMWMSKQDVSFLITARLITFCMMLGMVWVTYLLSLRVSQDHLTSLLAVLLLISWPLFHDFSIDIRPDVAQNLFLLLSTYSFVVFLQNKNYSHIFISGLLVSISFLFLQKTLFICVPFLVIAFVLFKSVRSTQFLFAYGTGFAIPILCMLFYFWWKGAWDDYVFNNWILNFHRPKTFRALMPLVNEGPKNYLHFLLFTMSFIYLSLRKKSDLLVVMFISLNVTYLAIMFVVPKPYAHNYLFFCSTSSILMALTLSATLKKSLPYVIIGMTLPGFIWLAFYQQPRNNHLQLKRTNYFHVNSTVDDYVYDGDIRYNLFRKDLDYFWYGRMEGKPMDTYNKLKRVTYDQNQFYQKLRESKPKFITTPGVDLKLAGLENTYREISFKWLPQEKIEPLYERVDQ